MAEHLVKSTRRGKRNDRIVVVPDDAEPGDTLIIDGGSPPIYCAECGINTLELAEGSYVSIPASRLMELRRAKPTESAAEGPKPVADPSSFSID